MFGLLTFSSVFVFYSIYHCIYIYYLNYSNKNLKNKTSGFENEESEYFFHLLYIDFFDIDNNDVLSKIYNKEFVLGEQIYLEFNFQVEYEYFVTTYSYKDVIYKFLSTSKNLTFPMYIEQNIKNYSYINKIKQVVLCENDKDITNIILEYVGPNYNFYNDLNNKQYIDLILKCENVPFTNNKLKLIDNFNNIYYTKQYNSILNNEKKNENFPYKISFNNERKPEVLPFYTKSANNAESDTRNAESDTRDTKSDIRNAESDTRDTKSDTLDTESDTRDAESDTRDTKSDTRDSELYKTNVKYYLNYEYLKWNPNILSSI